MDHETFEKFIQNGIELLENDIRKAMSNVSIVVQDFASPEQIRKMRMKHGQMMLGLYEGVPTTRRRNYSGVLPDKITIFKIPLLRLARSEQHLAQIVADTVWHEVAHHHGMNEEEVRKAERIRREMLANEQ